MCKRNYPLDWLRIVACYAVVSIHFGRHVPLFDLAVPLFMLLATYYSSFKDTKWLLKRIWRIYVPFMFWGVLGFVCRSIIERSFKLGMLFSQLIFGAPANSPLYFMSVLIVCTVVIHMVWNTCKDVRGRVIILTVITGVCFWCQYSGANGKMWSFFELPHKITMGRVVELMPYACVGVLFSMMRGGHNKVLWPLSVLGLVIGIFFRATNFELSFAGYNYGGAVRFLISSSLFLLIALLGEWFKWPYMRLNNIVLMLSSLTAGIYYSHKIIGEVVVRLIKTNSVVLTFIVFSVCAIVVAGIKRTKIKSVVV